MPFGKQDMSLATNWILAAEVLIMITILWRTKHIMIYLKIQKQFSNLSKSIFPSNMAMNPGVSYAITNLSIHTINA